MTRSLTACRNCGADVHRNPSNNETWVHADRSTACPAAAPPDALREEVWKLVRQAQNAAWNGMNEEEDALERISDEIAQLFRRQGAV